MSDEGVREGKAVPEASSKGAPGAEETEEGREDEEREMFVQACLAGGKHLRTATGFDELNYLRVVGSAHSDGRGFFLCRCADEVQKAGIALMRLPGFGDGSPESEWERAEDRAVEETFQDEQDLWGRKLSELLCLLILFSTANEQACYRHFLALNEAYRLKSALKSYKEFFECQPLGVVSHFESARTRMAEAQAGIANERWWQHGDAVALASKSKLYSRALKIASATERVLLGLEYSAYSRASEGVHFAVGSATVEPSNKVDLLAQRNGMLAVCILVRAHALLSGDAAQPLENVTVLHRAMESAPALSSFQGPVAAAGDFVVSPTGPAVITDARVSAFGYRTYRLEHLDASNAPEGEDWVPAIHVRILMRRDGLVRAAQQLPPELQRVMAETDSAPAREKAIRESVLAGWKLRNRSHR
jgi:hypothetical protein